jgi:hypothetical protein
MKIQGFIKNLSEWCHQKSTLSADDSKSRLPKMFPTVAGMLEQVCVCVCTCVHAHVNANTCIYLCMYLHACTKGRTVEVIIDKISIQSFRKLLDQALYTEEWRYSSTHMPATLTNNFIQVICNYGEWLKEVHLNRKWKISLLPITVTLITTIVHNILPLNV